MMMLLWLLFVRMMQKGDVKINGNMLVGNFEKKILEEFGIKVQVADIENTKLISDSITLTASGK